MEAKNKKDKLELYLERCMSPKYFKTLNIQIDTS